jgi:hypothetical protein
MIRCFYHKAETVSFFERAVGVSDTNIDTGGPCLSDFRLSYNAHFRTLQIITPNPSLRPLFGLSYILTNKQLELSHIGAVK